MPGDPTTKSGRAAAHPAGAILTWACALAPVVLLLCIVSLAVHVRIALGHWPRPMVDKYNTRLFDFHLRALVGLYLFCVYGAPLLWLGLLCFRKLRFGWKVHVRQLVACLAGWGLFLLLALVDPLDFLAWIFD